MSIKVKFSLKMKAKLNRIKRLPVLYENVLLADRKGDAQDLKNIYHNGIKFDRLQLQRLAETTVETKRKQNKPQPERPLYGMGDLEDDSLMNALEIVKTSKGYKVQFREDKHHEANLTLKQLAMIHEYGAKIVRGGNVIQIPPRHPFLFSYRKLMISIKADKRETSKHVIQAINDYIMTGTTNMIDKLQERINDKVNKSSK